MAVKNKKINEKYRDLVQAIFDAIAAEYERLYWNANQKNPDDPFCNTGGSYFNNVFSVHAYNWDWDERVAGSDINFNYKDGVFCATWYKHSHRGLYFWSKRNKKINAEFLNIMLKDCLKSMREDLDSGDLV